jgi:acetylornithine deacetylase/succinyl-diaminopimelate desuccinylase-like protein
MTARRSLQSPQGPQRRPGSLSPAYSAISALIVVAAGVAVVAQGPRTPDWSRLEDETMQHFQALLRLDTSNPPGNEKLATDYLKQVLEREGSATQVFALEPDRPNLVARMKGNGRKRPILLMGHTDVVTVDPRKWTFPPFSATRDGGYVYGRGSLDDRPHVVAGLMILLELKRLSVPLDRDVIFLAEAGEEGTTSVGVDFMTGQHHADIDAEYCLAEEGGVTRVGGKVKFAFVQTLEKNGRAIELTARGTSGHGSVPLADNALVHLAAAVAAVGRWRAPIRLNETTREYFRRLAVVSSPEDAARYRSVLTPDSREARAADDYFAQHEPRYASMLRTSVTPTVVAGGYRLNVIPSEAKATLDVRMLPDEDPVGFLAAVQKVVNDPAVEVAYGQRSQRPIGPSARLNTEAFAVIEAAITKNYQTATLQIMGTGSTDMSQVRARGTQCYGIGPASDAEDGPKGFGAHSDQERIPETELHRFVRFEWDVVSSLAAAR